MEKRVDLASIGSDCGWLGSIWTAWAGAGLGPVGVTLETPFRRVAIDSRLGDARRSIPNIGHAVGAVKNFLFGFSSLSCKVFVGLGLRGVNFFGLWRAGGR